MSGEQVNIRAFLFQCGIYCKEFWWIYSHCSGRHSVIQCAVANHSYSILFFTCWIWAGLIGRTARGWGRPVCDRKLWKSTLILNAMPLFLSDSLRSRILIWAGRQSLPRHQRLPSLWLWRMWCVRLARMQRCSCHSMTQWTPSSSGKPMGAYSLLSFFVCFTHILTHIPSLLYEKHAFFLAS